MEYKSTVNFIVLTTQRSGATFFLKYLESHPDILCSHKTIFTQTNKFKFFSFDRPSSFYFKYRTKSIKNRLTHWIFRKRLIYNCLNEYVRSLSQDNKVVGLKISYNHIEKYPEIANWIVSKNVKIIHLIRNNILKNILSIETAKKQKLYHSSINVETLQVYVDPEKIKKTIRKKYQKITRFKKEFANSRYMEVYYESLLNNCDSEFMKVLKFLEVNHALLKKPEIIKINPDSIEEIIENYDEVKQSLKNTIFEKYINRKFKKLGSEH